MLKTVMEWALPIFFFLLITSGLVTITLLYYPTLVSFFLFKLTTCLIVLYIVVHIWTAKQINISLNISKCLAGVIVLYTFFNGCYGAAHFNPYHSYLVFCFLLFLALTMAIRISGQFIHFLYIISGVALLEIVICIAQFAGVLSNGNENFRVTGSLNNPNVTAMFIIMAVPAILTIRKNFTTSYKFLFPCSMILVFFCLCILKCRTAWVGASLIALLYINRKYKLWPLLQNLNRLKLSGIIVAALLFIIFISNSAYQFKKSSADGRLLIWKVSTIMIAQNPITGVGYGNFEHDYNLAQVKFLNQSASPDKYIQYAGYVKMAYNEPLQNLVEGGLIGCLLLIAFFLLLVKKSVDHENLQECDMQFTAFTGVIVFLFMSLVNFTIQAIPVMVLCLVYAAFLSAKDNNTIWSISPLKIKRLAAAAMLIGAITLLTNTTRLLAANIKNKKAAELVKNGNLHAALTIMPSLAGNLENYESYWRNYGNALLKRRDYASAIKKFHNALTLTSDPELYFKLAYCNERLNQSNLAINNYILSAQLEPGKLLPRVALMRLYWKMRDSSKAIAQAKVVLTIPVKVKSDQAYRYKQQARSLLYLINSLPPVKPI